MKAPAGGSLPHRGRWQGAALTDEGKQAFPFNQPRFYSIGVPSTPGESGATLSKQERAGRRP